MLPIVVKEYTTKHFGADERDFLVELEKYLKHQKLESALTVTPSGIKADSWVGVIQFRGINIQILPKLIQEDIDSDGENSLSREKKEAIFKNLIFMLSYTKKLPIKTSESSKLATAKNPFLEVLIREYSKSLFDCLKRVTPKNYVREEDNLKYLKGKIKFTENTKRNSINRSRIYCEFDEFSENNKLNQLFLFVSTCLYAVSNEVKNKKLLKFITNYYSEIELVKFDRFKTEKIKLSRTQKVFEKPFMLAKMFIENSSVDFSQKRFKNITLVWDMNRLFEEFIFELIKEMKAEGRLEEWNRPVAQKSKELLQVGGKLIRRYAKADILIKKKDSDSTLVLDTKYKQVASVGDVKDSDLYQVSTYCSVYGAERGVLLYPLWQGEEISVPCILNSMDERNWYPINIETINLKYSYIGNPKNLDAIKTRIKTILNFVG